MSTKKPKNQHGGARAGAGPKHKYGEPTTKIGFRVPASKVPEIKDIVEKKLDTYIVKK